MEQESGMRARSGLSTASDGDFEPTEEEPAQQGEGDLRQGEHAYGDRVSGRYPDDGPIEPDDSQSGSRNRLT